MRSIRNKILGRFKCLGFACMLIPSVHGAGDGLDQGDAARPDPGQRDGANDYARYLNRGLAKGKTGNFDEAIDALGVAIRINPASADAFYDRGICYQSLGKFDMAIKDYAEAVRINPAYALAYYNTGLAHLGQSDMAAAVVDFGNAIAADPNLAIAYYNRGLIRKTGKDYDGALADLSKAILLDADMTVAYDCRGWIHYEKHEYDAAIAIFKEVIRRDGGSPLGYNSLAFVLATCPVDRIRDGKRAVQLATSACDLSHWVEPNFLDTLAAACAEEGDFAAAVKWEKKCLECHPAKDLEAAAYERVALYERNSPLRY
jgi:tetratricopeptide (TPR) repeat protein